MKAHTFNIFFAYRIVLLLLSFCVIATIYFDNQPAMS